MKSYNILGITGVILGFWIISNNLLMLINKNIKYSLSMIISHLGIGLIILGVTGSSVWQKEKIIKMKINDEVKLQKYNIVLKDMLEIKNKNYVAIRGNFNVYNSNKNYFKIKT